MKKKKEETLVKAYYFGLRDYLAQEKQLSQKDS